MPVHNGARYLKQAIESVLDQNFSDFEFIVIDDGSSDDSLEIVDSFAKKNPRIKIVKNENNLGLQKSLNRGMRKADGKYIARIDHDDIWYDRDKLQKQVNFLQQNSSYALVGTAALCIDSDGKEINSLQYKTSDQEIRYYMLLSNQFAHPSVLIRKKYLEEVGFYSEDKKYKNVEDYELWLRLGKKYKLANLSDYSLKYRINPKGISLKNQFRQRLSGLKLSIKYSRYYPNSFRTILIKIFTLPLSRSTLDFLITKSSFVRNAYSRLSGTKKSGN